MKLSRCLFLVSVFLFAAPALAVQNPPSREMKTANDLFASQKWADAAKSYEAIIAAEPGNARAWYQLGMSRFSLQQFEAAIAAWRKNIDLTKNPSAMYNVACAYSRLNQKAKAIEWLEKAFDNKFSPFANIAADPDLANLREEPRFKELAASLDRKRRPCIYSDAARQFDFWLGEWDVFNPQGQKAGTSSIQQIADGCGILENWTGSLGGSGKSINFYDAATGRWHQYWIGGGGVAARYAGVYKDGAMRYEGESVQQSNSGGSGGAKVRTRLTFFNLDANTVRQHAEQSSDDGQTWTTIYDFKYVQRKSG